ncbi:hypothetical protein GCM10007880_65990 [Mesorhizobium amorphae]|nr:hypothetical protein GCM10007880_65990 [Mesorhizobium amorphae]
MLSLLDLMGADLPVPDHTTLSRRARRWEPSAGWQRHPQRGPLHVLVDSTGLKIYGADQWLENKHSVRSRRTWRQLHLAPDADGGEIVAHWLMIRTPTGIVNLTHPQTRFGCSALVHAA